MGDYNDMYRIMIESNNLGIHFCRQGNFQMAVMFHIQALKIAVSVMGQTSEDYRDSLYNLGNTFADAGNNETALKYLLASEIHTVLLGKDGDIKLVHLLNSIGYVMEALQDYAGAVLYLEEALDNLRRLSQTDSSLSDDYMCNMYYLAGVCERAGDLKKALTYYNETLALIKGQCMRYYPSCLNSIANVLTSLGEVEQSLTPRLAAVAQIKQFVGPQSISYAQCMRNLAVVYQGLGDFDRAKELLLSAVEIKRILLGSGSREFIREIMLLIDLYTKAGQSDRALEIFTRLLDEISSEYLSRDEAIRELTELYMDFGDVSRLNDLYKRVMETYADTLDEDEDFNGQ